MIKIILLLTVLTLATALDCGDIHCFMCKSKNLFKKCGRYCTRYCPAKYQYRGNDIIPEDEEKPPPRSGPASGWKPVHSRLSRIRNKPTPPAITDPPPPPCPNSELEACISIKQAHKRVRKCCNKKRVPTQCKPFCKLQISEAELNKLYWTPGCRSEPNRKGAGNLILQCQTQDIDHRECCAKLGVPEACIKYCNPYDETLHIADFSLAIKCAPVGEMFEKMIKCFHSTMNK